MGLPIPAGVGASGLPPPNDQANAVVSGQIVGIGPTAPFAFWGAFNLALYASGNTALTTTNGSSNVTLGAGTGLAAGDAVNSVNVPRGTTLATVSGTSGTLAFPPGVTNAAVISGTDNAATFTGNAVNYSASIQLERSFDGGATWVVCGVGGAGQPAVYATGTPVSVVVGEPERSVAYRLNCTTYVSGTINYRLSATGSAAVSLAVSSSI